jgi:leucyl-tRNA synthetase
MNSPLHILFARELRKNQTACEIIMWRLLRNRRFHGFKFLRQYPIVTDVTNDKTGFYIADFYCAEKKLAVEIDGLIHSDQVEYDKSRDEVMMNFGLTILRITNAEVQNNVYAVLAKIKNCLEG